MWAGYLALVLFLVAVSCVVSAIWKHDGPIWAMLFVAALACGLMLMA